METLNSKNETSSINKSNYFCEYNYLNQLEGYIPFYLYEKKVFCENNFYMSLAWYIDQTQKINPEGRKQEIQDFIDSIIKFQGTASEKLKYIENFLNEKKISRYLKIGQDSKANLLKMGQEYLETDYMLNKEGKLSTVFAGISSDFVPERYFSWFSESGLENNVIKENAKVFISSRDASIKRAEELKNKL